ncbi:tetratricopeptide repeat protein [Kytococcus sedentarius]|uniref:tetratricopeptide repeat protein n=1 Tax=Kytococcus sedentarius TaxID=1276 RepID=UPI0035BBE9FB
MTEPTPQREPLPRDGLDDLERFRRAQFLFEQRLFTEAAVELETLLGTADPGHGLDEVRLLLARSYYHSAQLQRAENMARERLAEHPEDAYMAMLLGRSLERQGRHEEAAPYLERARVLGQEL